MPSRSSASCLHGASLPRGASASSESRNGRDWIRSRGQPLVTAAGAASARSRSSSAVDVPHAHPDAGRARRVPTQDSSTARWLALAPAPAVPVAVALPGSAVEVTAAPVEPAAVGLRIAAEHHPGAERDPGGENSGRRKPHDRLLHPVPPFGDRAIEVPFEAPQRRLTWRGEDRGERLVLAPSMLGRCVRTGPWARGSALFCRRTKWGGDKLREGRCPAMIAWTPRCPGPLPRGALRVW